MTKKTTNATTNNVDKHVAVLVETAPPPPPPPIPPPSSSPCVEADLGSTPPHRLPAHGQAHPTNGSRKAANKRISAAFAEEQFLRHQQQQHPTVHTTEETTHDDDDLAASARLPGYDPDLSTPGSDLFRSVRDAGRWSFGVVSVECWVMNDSTHKLHRPPGGLWIDPAYLACEIQSNNNVALMRLIDESRTDFVPASPLGPGVGLVGALWAETAEPTVEATERWDKMNEMGLMDMELNRRCADCDSVGSDGDPYSERSGSGRTMTWGRSPLTPGGGRKKKADEQRCIRWREVGPLAIDPDQPYNPRLILLARAGLNLAAGVQFNLSDGHRGIVIYYARGTADKVQLRSKNNEVYLKRSADAIGAASALEEPRRMCINERRKEGQDVWRRARTKIQAAIALEGGLKGKMMEEGMEMNKESSERRKDEHIFHSEHNLTDPELVDDLSRIEEEGMVGGVRSILAERWLKFKCYLKKCLGGNNKPPPPFSNKEALFTFLGCAISLLVLTQLDRFLRGDENMKFIVLGPFGAFMTLQYGLTAAPASQPRNAMLGQAIAITIANVISYTSMPDWAKQTVATSVAIAVMVRLGITHPPAGAAALLFSTANHDWKILGIMLLGNVIAIAIATLINNLNPRRQYPTFWGRHHFIRDMILLAGKEKDPMLKPEKKK